MLGKTYEGQSCAIAGALDVVGERSTLPGTCPRCGVTPRARDIVVSPRPGNRYARTDPVTEAMRTPHRLLEPLPVSA